MPTVFIRLFVYLFKIILLVQFDHLNKKMSNSSSKSPFRPSSPPIRIPGKNKWWLTHMHVGSPPNTNKKKTTDFLMNYELKAQSNTTKI